MGNKRISLKKGYTNSEYEENKKVYQKMMDGKVVRVRLNADELALLKERMDEKGYVAVSAFIKDELFGFYPKKTVVKEIKEGNTAIMGRILHEELVDLAEKYTYVLERYNRDMAILHHMESVDVGKWAKTTDRWHLYLIKTMDDLFFYVNLIADKLGYFDERDNVSLLPEPGDQMTPDDIIEEDKRMRIERIAAGRGIKD